MASKQKRLMSDEKFDLFYIKLCDYYINLPYDRTKVALEELNYRDISKPFRFFANLKKQFYILNELFHKNPQSTQQAILVHTISSILQNFWKTLHCTI